MNIETETTMIAIRLLESYKLLEQKVIELERARGITQRADQLEEVKKDLELIKPLEQRLGQLRGSLVEQALPLPPDAKSAIDEAIKVVGQLLPKISDIEKATREDRAKLVPKIRSSVLGIEMQSAYQRNQ